MQKLTEEQSQWLIEKINKSEDDEQDSCKRCFNDDDFCASFSDIKQIINQCTEKKFPEIHMRPVHADDEEEIKVSQGWCDGGNTNCIILYSYEEYTHFSIEQFKDFASKINKIVEWLNE